MLLTMIPELEAQWIKNNVAFYRNAVFVASALVLLASCTLAHAGEREVVASVIAAEACSQGEIGMSMVAEVINNRALAWHLTPYQVVTAKNQFYGFTASNRALLYTECRQEADRLAQMIFTEQTGHSTQGALYFLAPEERLRSWHGARTITFKRHTFYKGK